MPGVKKQKTSLKGSRDVKRTEESPRAQEPVAEKEDVADSDDQKQEEIEETEAEAGSKPLPQSFKELGVIDQLCEACANMGFKAPTAVQAESIPLALQGRDLIGLAETGSGKTAAFALPILQGTKRPCI